MKRMAALAIFAKVPAPGEVKTRLFPHLTPEQAAELHQAFVLDTLTRFEPTGNIKRYLACSPSSTDPFFKQLSQDYQIDLLDQQGRDLGERMSSVVKTLMDRSCRRVVLMGTDSPTLPVAYVEMAFEALQKCPVALGPSADGGYYLIGLSRWIPELFEGISWSTEKVFDLTLQKIHSLGLECKILPQWFDVDDRNSLKVLADQLAQNPSLAPHSWKFLQSHRMDVA